MPTVRVHPVRVNSPSVSGCIDPARTESLRREARRVRWRLRHDLGGMHRSLRELHSNQPALVERRPFQDVGEVFEGLPVPSRSGATERFARSVAGTIGQGVLRYSDRKKLVRQAGRMGIERFEANLIIALVQHRTGTSRDESLETEPRGWAAPVALAALVQTSVVALAWWFLF